MIIKIFTIGFCFAFLISADIANAKMLSEQDNNTSSKTTTINQTEQVKSGNTTKVPYLPGFKVPRKTRELKWMCRCESRIDESTPWKNYDPPKSGGCEEPDENKRIVRGSWVCQQVYQ